MLRAIRSNYNFKPESSTILAVPNFPIFLSLTKPHGITVAGMGTCSYSVFHKFGGRWVIDKVEKIMTWS